MDFLPVSLKMCLSMPEVCLSMPEVMPAMPAHARAAGPSQCVPVHARGPCPGPRHGVLEDADRHFTAALEARGDVGLDDFGAYQNHPTNALAAALERIEALVGRPA